MIRIDHYGGTIAQFSAWQDIARTVSLLPATLRVLYLPAAHHRRGIAVMEGTGGVHMSSLQVRAHAYGQRVLARFPWLRKLLQYSFVFFLLKGLAWTALLAWPLARGMARF